MEFERPHAVSVVPALAGGSSKQYATSNKLYFAKYELFVLFSCL